MIWERKKKSEEKLGGKKLNKLLHLVWVGTPLASEENQPVQRLGRHSGLRFSRLRPLQKSNMALTPPESPRFPATTNSSGIWLMVAAVDSGLLELVLPAGQKLRALLDAGVPQEQVCWDEAAWWMDPVELNSPPGNASTPRTPTP